MSNMYNNRIIKGIKDIHTSKALCKICFSPVVSTTEDYYKKSDGIINCVQSTRTVKLSNIEKSKKTRLNEYVTGIERFCEKL